MNPDSQMSLMQIHEAKKRDIEERENAITELVAKTNADIEAYNNDGVPVYNPEYLKVALRESGEALMSELHKDVPYPFGPEGSQEYLYASQMYGHAIYTSNKVCEALFQLGYTLGEIPSFSKVVEKDLDNLLTPPNWKSGHRYTIGDKVMKGGRIQMCVKEHESEEFIDDPGYWRDVVSELSAEDKAREDDFKGKISGELVRETDERTKESSLVRIGHQEVKFEKGSITFFNIDFSKALEWIEKMWDGLRLGSRK